MFPTDLCTILSNYVATDVYALFNSLSENPQHEGGGQGPFTQCVKKTSDLVADGFPKVLIDS